MRSKTIAAVCALLAAMSSAVAGGGQGLNVDIDRLPWPQWQARLQMAAEPMAPAVGSLEGVATLRPRSAALFGDYYVAKPYFGQAGGVRLTSGVVVGTRGAVFGPGQVSLPGTFAFSAMARPGLASAANTDADGTQAWPYVGIGYSDASVRGGWGFSADLGLAAQSFGLFRAARSLGNQSLDDFVRDLRLTPVLQLGVSYRF
jgi:hypothetical protein